MLDIMARLAHIRGTASRSPRQAAPGTLWSFDVATKIKLTPAQRAAFDAYKFAEREFDRYMGSVFANAHGQRKHEEKVSAAYQACKRLGMDYSHGL